MYYTQILTGNLSQLLKQAVLETIKRGEKNLLIKSIVNFFYCSLAIVNFVSCFIV